MHVWRHFARKIPVQKKEAPTYVTEKHVTRCSGFVYLELTQAIYSRGGAHTSELFKY